MKTRSHVVSVDLPCSAQRAFDALVTPSAVRAWSKASRAIVVPKVGGQWAAAWGPDEDDPDYATSAHILVFDPPKRLLLTDYVYRARAGRLPFELELSTEFAIEPQQSTCRLRVTQDGFPGESVADAHYETSGNGWKNSLAALREYVSRRA